MPKDSQIYVRITEEEKAQLEQLASITKRSQSDMIRWLISQEWAKMSSLPASINNSNSNQSASSLAG